MVSEIYRIAISGKKNTGKNTLAKMFRNNLGPQDVSVLAFADPIKEMAHIMFPSLPRKYLYGASKWRNSIVPNAHKDGKPLTVRQLLIDIGTGLGRGYQDTIWLNNFDVRCGKVQKNHQAAIVVTDTRFLNEFNHLKQKRFYQVRLYRDTGEPNSDDISETDLDNIPNSEFDYVLFNNRSLEELKQEVITKVIPRIPFV